jgi:hypothetical protein
MMMKMHTRRLGGLLFGLALLPSLAIALAAGETFKATASVKSPTAAASAPVTIKIDRFVTDAERDTIVTAVRGNDHAATRKALEAAPDIGYIDVGSRRTPIKYAYARSTGAGRMITVLTAKPVLYLGSGVPGAKAKGEYELALVLLILDGQNAGDGEFSPAVTLKVDEQGAVVTTDYSHEVVRLTGISKVQ